MWIDQRVSRRPSRHRWLCNSLCPLAAAHCPLHGRGEIIVRASLKTLFPRAYDIILAVFWLG